jgi:hypothetical protein
MASSARNGCPALRVSAAGSTSRETSMNVQLCAVAGNTIQDRRNVLQVFGRGHRTARLMPACRRVQSQQSLFHQSRLRRTAKTPPVPILLIEVPQIAAVAPVRLRLLRERGVKNVSVRNLLIGSFRGSGPCTPSRRDGVDLHVQTAATSLAKRSMPSQRFKRPSRGRLWSWITTPPTTRALS